MQPLKLTVSLIAISALLTACGPKEPPETVWEIPPRYVGGGMPGAIEKAKASLDDFLALQAKPPEGTKNFHVLVKKPSGKPQYEFNMVWVGEIEPVETGFVGVIEDSPGDVAKSARDGNKLAFTKDEIQDWGFIGPNGIYGQFVLRQELENSAERGTDVSALQSRYMDLSELVIE